MAHQRYSAREAANIVMVHSTAYLLIASAQCADTFRESRPVVRGTSPAVYGKKQHNIANALRGKDGQCSAFLASQNSLT